MDEYLAALLLLGLGVGGVLTVYGASALVRVADKPLVCAPFLSGMPVIERLGDGTVAAAVANMVLHHAPDPAAMIAEMARVVRPGGECGHH